ncbi:hypothetical protein OKW33_002695 [Paraburkholderia atlantica]|uniref:hypothetical protein n=1 Tax=Paraburkholderia atlantica TaxID=2654982 RepID=UPI003D199F0C
MKLSESFSSQDWELDQRELVFLVLDHHPLSVSAFVLMERMRANGGFVKPKMRMSQMYVFDVPVAASELNIQNLDTLVCTPERMRRLDRATWTQLLARFREVRPEATDAIDRIVAMREVERRLFGESERVARLNEQRDGLGLALDIGNLDRRSVLQGLDANRANDANSIFDLLDVIPVHERSMLEHDARLFEQILGAVSAQSAVFQDDTQRSVRVHVTDQTDLESVLGIDLIIYSTRHDNFLLLQYKRMEKDDQSWSYSVSPSSNLHQQLGQMVGFRTTANDRSTTMPPSLWSYRLNDDPFYFKFCEQFRPTARDASLIPGITMSAAHLEEFLGLPEAKGPKGGVSVGYQNCPRYLNNTEFVQLAQAGWIGAGRQSAALMKEILTANRDGGRSAMLAVVDMPKATSAAGRAWKM